MGGRQDQDSAAEESHEHSLQGTTLRIYRLLLRSRVPLGVHDIQRGLGLSSPSVAQYHIKKLAEMRLIREEGGGYTVDRVIVDNVIRIRRTSFPLQVVFVAFFASSLVILLTLLRPDVLTSTYMFATVVITIGLILAIYETQVTLRRL